MAPAKKTKAPRRRAKPAVDQEMVSIFGSKKAALDAQRAVERTVKRVRNALGGGERGQYAPSHTLATPPPPGRARELWLQHVAGAILFAHVRDYAISNLSAKLDEKTRLVAIQAINQALYGVMMVADGVSGSFRNERCSASVSMAVTLEQKGHPPERLDLSDGDGMCMGFHNWLEGDFGEDRVVERPSDSRSSARSRT
jgi:hypothetical protein